jgi:hypothetical protein
MVKNTCQGDLNTYLIVRYFKLLTKRIERFVNTDIKPLLNYKALYFYLKNSIKEDDFVRLN